MNISGREPQRDQPLMAAAQYKTYAIASPIETHTRRASCREVECGKRANGWKTVLDTSKPKHAKAANWIRLQSGKFFVYTQVGTVVTFTFQAGQDCFEPHRVSLERPELFMVQGGDWRGNPLNVPTRVHANGDDWVDDFANHQEKIAILVQRG